MRYVVMTTVMVCAVATVSVRAQEPGAQMKQAAERHATIEAKAQNLRVAVDTRLTKNAPYSAEAVTESTQLLADGNRIVTKNATRIVRDSEGRTRREQLNAAGTDALNISISDPVAGITYVLDPVSHLAYRNGLLFVPIEDKSPVLGPDVALPPGVMVKSGTVTMARSAEGGLAVVTRDQKDAVAADGQAEREFHDGMDMKTIGEMKTRIAVTGGEAGNTMFVASGAFPARIAEASGQTTREDIGQQMIEGVMAVGTRTLTEIPAGAIGNEQPIKILSEQWFSPELQVLVMTKHIDPRVGETIYRLTGIVRAEPAHALFDLPPDYTLNDSVIRRDDQR